MKFQREEKEEGEEARQTSCSSEVFFLGFGEPDARCGRN
jgi:hypothetical protein